MQQVVKPPSISLKDAMQPDFDTAELGNASDVNLYNLLSKVEFNLFGWTQQEKPLEAHELIWCDHLKNLHKSIRLTLNTRYGCND